MQNSRSDSLPLEERFNGCLGLLGFRMKRFGYLLYCSVDIIRCFSLLRSDFVVEFFQHDPLMAWQRLACVYWGDAINKTGSDQWFPVNSGG